MPSSRIWKGERMSKIDDLIAQLSPDGVGLEKLSQVCDIENTKRKPVKASLRISGKIPYYGANNVQDHVEGFTHDGSYVLIAEDGSADLDNYSIQYTEGKFWANNHVHVIKGKDGLNTRFLFHYLSGMNFRPFLSGGGRAKLTKGKMIEIGIPVPHPDVQEEIVDILDKFTKLEAELEAELEAREKQYNHYRDELLSFNEGTPWFELQKIAEFKNGKGHEKNIDENGSFVVVNSKFVSTEGKVKKYSIEQICPVFKDDILMVMSDLPNGKALAKCFFVETDGKYTLNQRICALTTKNRRTLLPKFLFYILSRNKQLLRHDNGADQTNLRKGDILKIKIPVPDSEEQERIVAILDKFDALVNDISSGLPAEINARRQQYEYYRNQLLTFKEAV